jgi:transcriptional regulator with XRE-family HTH domain
MNNIKRWRLERRLTQEQAASALSYSVRHYQKLEAGHSPLNERTIFLMGLIK